MLSRRIRKLVLQKSSHSRVTAYRFSVVNSLGWSLGYVTPTKVFGAPPCIVERDFGDLDLRKYRSAETLRDWQDNILPLCAGNSRLMFAIMCAFAGPLLEILESEASGFQLFGPSSIGKTIILIVGGSVWGCRVGASAHLGFLETWATTLEGVEPYGRMHNDGLLLLDETRQAGNDREMGKSCRPLSCAWLRERRKTDWSLSVAAVIGRLSIWAPAICPCWGSFLLPAWSSMMLTASASQISSLMPVVVMGCSRTSTVSPTLLLLPKSCSAGRAPILVRPASATWSGWPRIVATAASWLVSGLRVRNGSLSRNGPAGSVVDGRIADQFRCRHLAAGMLARHYGFSRGAARRSPGPSRAVSAPTTSPSLRTRPCSTPLPRFGRTSPITSRASARCPISASPRRSSSAALASFTPTATAQRNT